MNKINKERMNNRKSRNINSIPIEPQDMVEVIRCKACPYSELMEDTWYCSYWRKNTIEDGYCHIGSE